MKKLLLIGSSGKIGSYLYSKFVDNFDLYTVSRSKPSHKNFEYDFLTQQGDLSELNNIKFDFVINCVGLLPKSKLKIGQFEKVNADSISQLKFFLDPKVVFIQLSTISVYGESIMNRPITERDPTFPKNNYAITKLSGEDHCKLFFKNLIIFRIPPVYLDYKDSTLFKRFIKNKLMEFKFGDDSQFHSYCSLETLSNYINLCLKNKVPSGLYHIADSEVYSNTFLKSLKDIDPIFKIFLPKVIFRILNQIFQKFKISQTVSNKINEIYFKLFCDNIYCTKKIEQFTNLKDV